MRSTAPQSFAEKNHAMVRIWVIGLSKSVHSSADKLCYLFHEDQERGWSSVEFVTLKCSRFPCLMPFRQQFSLFEQSPSFLQTMVSSVSPSFRESCTDRTVPPMKLLFTEIEPYLKIESSLPSNHFNWTRHQIADKYLRASSSGTGAYALEMEAWTFVAQSWSVIRGPQCSNMTQYWNN